MLKEVTLEEALRAGREGVSPMVILTVPGRKACFRLPLYELLSTCIFLVDDNPEQRPEIPPPAENTAPETEQQEAPSPRKKEPKRKQVDTGKIMALHNAGWSNVKIADEMKLHPITVGKYIKQLAAARNKED